MMVEPADRLTDLLKEFPTLTTGNGGNKLL
jgi:hypothetical protein